MLGDRLDASEYQVDHGKAIIRPSPRGLRIIVFHAAQYFSESLKRIERPIAPTEQIRPTVVESRLEEP